MATRDQRSERRMDALSKQKIVEAAVAILDTDGEGALTFRSLAARLSTGPGAIYHHIANKDDLLAATTDHVVTRGMASVPQGSGPREGIRAAAVGVFDTIDEHPWAGTQLVRQPWQPAIAQILESIGGRLHELGVPPHARFDAATALVSYILGLAAQYAAAARSIRAETNRTDALTAVAAQWTKYDPADYPFLQEIAAALPEHDDREQFLAGIDLVLAGISASFDRSDA